MKNTSRREYTIDFTERALTLSASFAAKANDPTSDEYALVCQFQHDFPSFRIVRKTHKTPTRYKNSDGSITERNKHNGLTYERMERFMSALPDGVDYLEAYFDLRGKAEATPSNAPNNSAIIIVMLGVPLPPAIGNMTAAIAAITNCPMLTIILLSLLKISAL